MPEILSRIEEKIAKLSKKINIFIKKKLITIPDVMNKIIAKREYISTQPDQSSIPKEHNVILFSPASASFDSFKNFEERGKYFNKQIKKQVNS